MPSRFKEALNSGKFVVTSEVAPPKGTNLEKFLHHIDILKDKVDGLNVTDHQSSVMRFPSLGGCLAVKERGGEAIMQMTCRDRNRLAMQSDLLGAAAMGIHNVLCLTGDHQIFGDQPEAKGVFDLDSVQLVAMVEQMNRGTLLSGQEMKKPTDFLIGVAVGLGATILLFVINYSQIKIVRHTFSGTDITSNVERSDIHRRKLKELGAHIIILELQSYIFFGTANSLYAQIKSRLSETQQGSACYIILDFCRVSGLDSSAVFSFIKCKQIAETHKSTLILTSLSDRIYRQLEAGGLYKDDAVLRIFPDLDRGLEWCEEQLLESAGLTGMPEPYTLNDRLKGVGFKDEDISKLISYLERIEIAEGEYLILQGEESNDLFLLESGQLSIYLELENENYLRLQTTGTRTIIGEIGMYLGITRTASVIANEPSVVYRLSKISLAKMREESPDLAATFHEFAAHQLAERLVDTTRLVSALSR